ncbi:MAG: DUF86 domain-containing protein [Candidatus Zhuqueibacterota bacterium]
MRNDIERIFDINEAISRIEKYSQYGKSEFEGEELIQNWIIHHLQIIGEAGARLSKEFKRQYDKIPWDKIIGMRNILVHNYFEIDAEIVWAVIVNDLPDLKIKIQNLLKTLNTENSE